MSDRSGENKEAQDAEADQEQVKIAVVALSHAIAHPRTVMVESRFWNQIKTITKKGYKTLAQRDITQISI